MTKLHWYRQITNTETNCQRRKCYVLTQQSNKISFPCPQTCHFVWWVNSEVMNLCIFRSCDFWGWVEGMQSDHHYKNTFGFVGYICVFQMLQRCVIQDCSWIEPSEYFGQWSYSFTRTIKLFQFIRLLLKCKKT